jgi:hypothetical protein
MTVATLCLSPMTTALLIQKSMHKKEGGKSMESTKDKAGQVILLDSASRSQFHLDI